MFFRRPVTEPKLPLHWYDDSDGSCSHDPESVRHRIAFQDLLFMVRRISMDARRQNVRFCRIELDQHNSDIVRAEARRLARHNLDGSMNLVGVVPDPKYFDGLLVTMDCPITRILPDEEHDKVRGVLELLAAQAWHNVKD